MGKRAWIDVETTGIDPDKCAILTLAYLIDIDGKVATQGTIKMKPFDGAHIDEEALKVNNLTIEEISGWPEQKYGYYRLVDTLNENVNKYNKKDKFVFCAYNATFDDRFVRKLFDRNGDNYYGSYFFWPKIDVQTLVAMEISRGLRLPIYNLETLCNHYKIKIDAHDAMSDILATRELYIKIRKELLK